MKLLPKPKENGFYEKYASDITKCAWYSTFIMAIGDTLAYAGMLRDDSQPQWPAFGVIAGLGSVSLGVASKGSWDKFRTRRLHKKVGVLEQVRPIASEPNKNCMTFCPNVKKCLVKAGVEVELMKERSQLTSMRSEAEKSENTTAFMSAVTADGLIESCPNGPIIDPFVSLEPNEKGKYIMHLCRSAEVE